MAPKLWANDDPQKVPASWYASIFVGLPLMAASAGKSHDLVVTLGHEYKEFARPGRVLNLALELSLVRLQIATISLMGNSG